MTMLRVPQVVATASRRLVKRVAATVLALGAGWVAALVVLVSFLLAVLAEIAESIRRERP